MKGKTWLAIFITFLMITGLGGLFLGNEGGSYAFRYNDISFQVRENYYVANVDGVERTFFMPPDQAENFDFPNIDNLKTAGTHFFSTALEDPLAQPIEELRNSIAFTLFDTNQIYVQPAVLAGESELPTITCENASTNTFVITAQSGNTTVAEGDGNCLSLTVQHSQDVLIFFDLINYHYFDIIENGY